MGRLEHADQPDAVAFEFWNVYWFDTRRGQRDENQVGAKLIHQRLLNRSSPPMKFQLNGNRKLQHLRESEQVNPVLEEGQFLLLQRQGLPSLVSGNRV